MTNHSLFRSIASVHTDVFLIRASARAVLENRPIRGVVELLLIGEEPEAHALIEAGIIRMLHPQGVYVSVAAAESVQSYFKREPLAFNRLAIRVDEPNSMEIDPDWDAVSPVLKGVGAADLLDWCIRIAETGDLAGVGEVNEVHPSASRIMSLPRFQCMLRLTQLLVSRHVVEGLRLLDALGLMAILLPEISGLKGFHLSSPHHHKDVYEHTLQVVNQAVPSPLVRWSALLHDIGKLHTRSFTADGQVHFFKHDEVGAYLSDGVMARLSFPKDLSAGIHQLVILHLRPGLYTPDWSDAAVRRLMKEAGTVLNALFDLARADNTTKRMSKRRANLRNVKALADRCAALSLEAERSQVKLPRGLGHAIKLQFELEPGPRIGELCALCYKGVLDGHLSQDATVEHHLAFLRNTPELMNRLPEAASSLSN